jgi:hypothetical protein
MSRQSTRSKGTSEPRQRAPVIQSSLHLPEVVYEALRKIAFDERAKIHDLVVEGLDGVLKRRGYPSIRACTCRRRSMRLAFDERVKIHNLVVEGLDGVLKRRGYPSVESLKAICQKVPLIGNSSMISRARARAQRARASAVRASILLESLWHWFHGTVG